MARKHGVYPAKRNVHRKLLLPVGITQSVCSSASAWRLLHDAAPTPPPCSCTATSHTDACPSPAPRAARPSPNTRASVPLRGPVVGRGRSAARIVSFTDRVLQPYAYLCYACRSTRRRFHNSMCQSRKPKAAFSVLYGASYVVVWRRASSLVA